LLPASDTASELIEVFKGITLRQSWSPAELEVIRTLLQRKGKFLFKPHELPNLCNALAHAAEFGEAFCDALKTYHEVFFAEEEQRLGAALAAGLAEAQQLSGGHDLDDLLTTLSRGVHFSDLNHMERVIVAPSYWANPLVFYRHIQPDQALLLFGSRPEGLGVSAGESAPSHLVFVLKAVADSSRLVILRALTEGPQTPGQLARRLRLRPPTVIHHLNTLRLAGLVEITLQSETERAYTLHRAALAKTMDILSDYLGESKNTL
jgi:DNA-binding transcriptional ArsR family regulator